MVKILRYRYCLGVADFVVAKLSMHSASGRVRIQITLLALAGVIAGASAVASGYASAGPVQAGQSKALSKTDFDIIEGIFHDGLGTYAEVMLANELISLSRIKQPPFDASQSKAKMLDAINRLPASHPSRAIFQREIANIESGVKTGAAELLKQAGSAHLTRVRHTALEYADARAADLVLEFSDRADLPVSVKADK